MNMAALLGKNCVAIDAATKQTATLLFLHGLGDTGHGWASIFKDICPPYVKIICPTASVMPVSVNSGFRMPSWFDIYSLNKGGTEDEPGIRKAAQDVHAALESIEESGIPSNRILLGGFSQGGSLATFSALTYKRPLAGLLCLSFWVPINDKLSKEAMETNKDIPILQCHGDSDPVVSYKFGEMTAEFFKSINCKNHTFNTYKGLVHSSSPQELSDIQQWLAQILPPQGGSM